MVDILHSSRGPEQGQSRARAENKQWARLWFYGATGVAHQIIHRVGLWGYDDMTARLHSRVPPISGLFVFC